MLNNMLVDLAVSPGFNVTTAAQPAKIYNMVIWGREGYTELVEGGRVIQIWFREGGLYRVSWGRELDNVPISWGRKGLCRVFKGGRDDAELLRVGGMMQGCWGRKEILLMWEESSTLCNHVWQCWEKVTSIDNNLD